MCELNAYVIEAGGESLLLEGVDSLKVEGGKVRLRSLFGEERVLEGTFKEMSLKGKRIVIEKS